LTDCAVLISQVGRMNAMLRGLKRRGIRKKEKGIVEQLEQFELKVTENMKLQKTTNLQVGEGSGSGDNGIKKMSSASGLLVKKKSMSYVEEGKTEDEVSPAPAPLEMRRPRVQNVLKTSAVSGKSFKPIVV